jgi:hypothetical protein
MGIVLLAAIAVGQQIGSHTIFAVMQKRPTLPGDEITPVPDPTASDELLSKNWKRLQVVSVATDPAFPDPRVTPPPPPTPRPVPTAPPTPKPRPTPSPPPDIYTSPPLPFPLVSHDPDESPSP